MTDAAITTETEVQNLAPGRWLVDGQKVFTKPSATEAEAIATLYPPAPTAEEKAARAAKETRARLAADVDKHVEATAKARGYNDAASLASYVPSTNASWAAEAGAFVAWRDAVWAHAIAALEDVQAGTRAVPDAAELIAELPEIAWA